MEPVKKIRVLIADDHNVVLTGLRFLINAEPDMQVVGEAGDGDQALRLARKLMPDILPFGYQHALLQRFYRGAANYRRDTLD
ncbi:MAG: response regulator transcription factor [Moorella sp. (in: firmicutes)]